MYIRIGEIPRGGLDVTASRGTAWIPRLLEGMNPHPLKALRLASAELFLSLEGRNLFARGSFSAEGEAVCDRCTAPVGLTLAKDFEAVLVPGGHGPAESRDVELHEDDLEIGFYDGGGIEVADIFWEQVALAIPVKVLCREECRGICARCGADRNREGCSCPEAAAQGPFDALKNLREKKE